MGINVFIQVCLLYQKSVKNKIKTFIRFSRWRKKQPTRAKRLGNGMSRCYQWRESHDGSPNSGSTNVPITLPHHRLIKKFKNWLTSKSISTPTFHLKSLSKFIKRLHSLAPNPIRFRSIRLHNPQKLSFQLNNISTIFPSSKKKTMNEMTKFDRIIPIPQNWMAKFCKICPG